MSAPNPVTELIAMLEGCELADVLGSRGRAWDGKLVVDHELMASAIATLRWQHNRLLAFQGDVASECARAAIAAADKLHRELSGARSVLQELAAVISEDKDGSFFICKEAEPIVEAAMREARK